MHVLNGRKDDFTKYLDERGIESSPVHYRNDKYDCTFKFQENDLPGVNSFSETQICIPNGWWLSESDISYIIQTLNSYN
jgi:dTDP-4-amino-4,6-dideoxygalactose transaminase